ncbi:MAG: hypothetical protein Kow0068_24360 [Marinilabiliales bacterium]
MLKFRDNDADLDNDTDVVAKLLIPKIQNIHNTEIIYRDDLKLLGMVLVNKIDNDFNNSF